MKLVDIFEMTYRTGFPMNNMPFPDFYNQQLKLEGKMQHGYEVYSFQYNDTIIYGVRVGDEFASFVQLKSINIPNLTNTFESLSSMTKPTFAGDLLSYKLRHFLIIHLGISILIGNTHSIATEKVLPKIAHMFKTYMCNIKTGELQNWTIKNYQQLTSTTKPTEWQVLLVGSPKPYATEDCHTMDWSGDVGRHLWTYIDFFNEFEGELNGKNS